MKTVILQIVLLFSVGILCHGQANGYFSNVLSPKEFDNSVANRFNSDIFSSVSYYRNKFWDKVSHIINRHSYEPFVLIKTNIHPNNYFKELNDNSLKRVLRDAKQNTSDDSTSNQNMNNTLSQTTSTTVSSSAITKSNELSTDKFELPNNVTSFTPNDSKIAVELFTNEINNLSSSTSTLTPPLISNRSDDKTSYITSEELTCCKPLKIFSVFALIIVALGVIIGVYKKRQRGTLAIYQVGNICRGKEDTPV